MKQYTGINLLCGLIILILAISVCIPIYKFGYAFGYGFAEGMNHTDSQEADSIAMYVPVAIDFEPTADNYLSPRDSIMLSDKSTYPILVSQGIVMVPSEKTDLGIYISKVALSLIAVALVIVLIVAFIKFVVSINKGKIFDSRNVRLLARIGYLLLSLCLLNVVEGIFDVIMAHGICASADGYSLSASWSLPFTDALLGVLALMLAAIWKKGLAMQSEQELTI